MKRIQIIKSNIEYEISGVDYYLKTRKFPPELKRDAMTAEVVFYIFGMKCSLVAGRVKVLDVFSKPFSLLGQNIELEADYEYTKLWEEQLQSHIDDMRDDHPEMHKEWLNNLPTNKGADL